MRNYSIFFALCLLISTPLKSTIDYLSFYYYPNESEISQAEITGIYMDSKGFTWFSTVNGLLRFDGTNFYRYKSGRNLNRDISGNFITPPIEDRQGNLWVGSQNGLNLYERKAGLFKQIHIKNRKRINEPCNYYINPFYIDSLDNIWLYTNGEILRYNPQTDSIVFVSFNSNGLNLSPQSFYKNMRLFVSNETKGFHINRIQDNVLASSLFFDKKNNIDIVIHNIVFENQDIGWIASNVGLIRLDLKTNQWICYNQYQGKSIKINSISSVYHGQVFVATEGDGLLLFDTKKKQFIQSWKADNAKPNSLKSNTIKQCYIGKNNILFLIDESRTLAVAYLKEPIVKPLLITDSKNRQLENAGVQGISKISNDELLLCYTNGRYTTYNTIKQTRNKTFFLPSSKTGSTYSFSQSEIENGKKILMYDRGKFLFWDKQDDKLISLFSKQYPDGIFPFNVYQIFDYDNQVFLATENGLFELSIVGNQYAVVPIDGLNRQLEWTHLDFFIILNKNIWITHSRYTKWEVFQYATNTFKKLFSTKASFEIRDYTLYRDTLYLATTDGVYQYASNKLILIDTRNKSFNSIIESNGKIYAVGDQSVSVITSDGKEQLIDKYHGLTGELFLKNSKLLLGNNLYLGNNRGVIELNTSISNFRRNYFPYISELQINEELYQDSSIMEVQSLTLPYNQNYLNFKLSVIGYRDPDNNEIMFKLNGSDKSYNTLLKGGYVRYPNLAPGEYRLELRDGAMHAGQILKITIKPPYWRTFPFYLISLLILLGIIYLLVSYRTTQLKREEQNKLRLIIRSQEEERIRLARDLHDDFGARLSAIKLYLQAALNPNSDFKMLVQNSSEAIDNTISELRHLLTELSPKTLTEHGLAAAIEEISSLMTRTGKVNIHIDTTGYYERSDPDFNFSIYRIILELMHNTVKYAQAKNIDVSLINRDGETVLIYSDDGIGFDPKTISKGYGLKNIESYVSNLHGKYSIDSSEGKGAHIVIEIPIH